jgi:hypothetical protein
MLLTAVIFGTTSCELFEEEKPCGDKKDTGIMYIYDHSPDFVDECFNIYEGAIMYRFYYPSNISQFKMCPKEHIKVWNQVDLSPDCDSLLPNLKIDGKVVIGTTGSFIFFHRNVYNTHISYNPENDEDIGLQQVFGDQAYGWISGYIDIIFDYPGSVGAADTALYKALKDIWMSAIYYEPKQ